MQLTSADGPRPRWESVVPIINAVIGLYFCISQGVALWLIGTGRAGALAGRETRVAAALAAAIIFLMTSVATPFVRGPLRPWLLRAQTAMLIVLAAVVAGAEIRLALLGSSPGGQYSIAVGYGAILVGYAAFLAQRVLGIGQFGGRIAKHFYLIPALLLAVIEVAAVMRLG